MTDAKPGASVTANPLTINPVEAKLLIAFLKRPMNLEGDESVLHAALIQKLTMIMQTPQGVADDQLACMDGDKGEHRKET